jgi:uncharacterized protein (TIGR00266 family)
MQYELLYPGVFTMLKVQLEKGETIKAESGAMVAMSSTIDIAGKMEGGLKGGFSRLLSGESFFFQTLEARRGSGEVFLSHSIPGDIHALELDGTNDYILQKDGFFAGSKELHISTKVQNLSKGLFSGEGFFVIRVSGKGLLFVSSYGVIHPIHIPDEEEIIVDNSHIVAWPDTMSYTLEKASSGWISGWVSSITSGEGLVCRFKGPGCVLIQTRNPTSFGGWIRQYIPAKA